MIYLDNNSTTKPRPEVIEAMMPYFTEKWYNPSANYEAGQEIARDIEDARAFFAQSINAEPEEIYFVSCGSEANNWALRCLNTPVITDNIEHHSILNALPPYSMITKATHDGRVNIQQTKELITHNPKFLVSLMWINNELGTIQPIEEIGKIAKDYGCLFHSDATQAYTKLPIDVKKCNIDMLTTSSHKVGAPRGSGFLYIRKDTPIKPLIYGGQQERHMRAGTENVACIMAFKKATEIAMKNMKRNTNRLQELQNYFVARLDKIGVKIINRDMQHFPSTLSVDCGVPAESMLAYLDQFNIAVSSGSACNSHDDKPSHVLKAIGLSDEEAGRVIRFSLSPDITIADLDYVVEIFEAGIQVIKG